MMRLLLLPALLLGSCASAPSGAVLPEDADRDARETLDLLREILRFDTSNPPGNETPCLRHLAGLLRADGIESEIVEARPGRGNLVARLKGTGAKRPILLMAHVDVVGVDPAEWTVDPFAAEIRDGFLWGRGALDDKDGVAVFTQAMRVLARRKTPLSRDVILMLNADEESSGIQGAKFMIERHWEKIDCEFAFSEGGSASLRDGKVALFGFETAEKVYNDFRLWIRGGSGHSSVPLPQNAIYDAARLLARAEEHRTPLRVIETVRQSFLGMAGSTTYVPYGQGEMKRAADGDLAAVERLARNPGTNALLRSTLVPTMIKGGTRANVLPSDVEINFNARLLPGDTIDDVIRGLMTHLGIAKYDVVEGGPEAVERYKRERKDASAAVFLSDRGVDAPASSTDTDGYRALVKAAAKLSPGALAVPRLTPGATDLRYLRLKGVQGYGLAPCPAGEEEESTAHKPNERVRVSSIGYGLRFVLEVVEDLCR